MILMFFAAACAVALSSVALVLAPLSRVARPAGRLRPGALPGAAAPAARSSGRAAALQALQELEFDFELGNLTPAEYRTLRTSLVRQALAPTAAHNRRPAANALLVEELEREVHALRARRLANGRRCRACKSQVATTQPLCPACGARLDQLTWSPAPAIGDQAVSAAPRRQTKTPDAPTSGGRIQGTHGEDGTAGTTSRAGSSDVNGRPSAPDRARWWLAGSAVLAAGFLAGVVYVYEAGVHAQASHQPVGSVSVVAARALAVDPGAANRALLGHGQGIQETADGGRSWQPGAGNTEVTGLAFSPANPRRVYLGGPGVLRTSTDGGRTWDDRSAALPSPDIEAIAPGPDQDQMVYLFVRERGLYRSRDGGTNWELVSDRPTQGITALAVGPGDRPLVFAGGPLGVLRSADGGRTWGLANGALNGALGHTDVRALVYSPGSGDVGTRAGGVRLEGAVYAGTSRGIWKSVDGGSSWIRLPLTGEIVALAVEPAHAARLWALDALGRVYRSADGGASWGGGR